MLSWDDLLGVLVGENVYWNVTLEFLRKHTKRKIGKEHKTRGQTAVNMGAEDL